MSETHLHLDYETASKADLRKVGTDVYSRHSTTKALMLNYAFDDGPVKLIEFHQRAMPPYLIDAMRNPHVRKIAHNAQFEIAITRQVLKIETDPSQWWCTMVMALSLGLPAALEQLIADALKLPKEFHKDAEGKRLMKMFSFPSSKATPQSHPEEWEAYCNYGGQDVVAEKKVFKVLRNYIPNMDALFRGWELDQKINSAGLPVDYGFIESAKKIAARAKAEFREKMIDATGLANPNSVKQLLPWLRERGYPFNELRKNRVEIAIREHGDDIDGEAKSVLKLRMQSNKTSTTKFDAIERASINARLRNTYQYRGAAATGRYAGRILGQNMPRPWKGVEEHLGGARDLILEDDYDGLTSFFGEPLECVVSSIRSAIAAPHGKKLVVADLSSIELVVIAWLTGCEFWLDVVASGKDAYKAFAERWLGVPYADVQKWQRALSKPPALGCFGANTEVLTERGWVPIIAVLPADRVFDGVEFVSHDGVVDQGVKQVIDLFGVEATPDHLVLCGEGEWLQAGDVVQEGTSSRQAIALATGLCSRLNITETRGTTAVSARTVGTNTSSTEATWKAAKRSVVSSALAALRTLRGALSTVGLASPQKMSNGYRIGSTRCGLDVSGAAVRTRSTQDEASGASSSRPKISSPTPAQLQGGTTLNSTLTEKTTTATTRKETSASSRAPTTSGTDNTTCGLSIKVGAWLLKTSIKIFARAIEMLPRSSGSYVQDSLRNKSSTAKANVEVRTFDIANAGPRNRFVIRTDAGPLVVHNCGYRMGAGRQILNPKTQDFEKTGLWGYAANMGVEMSQAQCKEAVKIYRDLSPEIVQAWYDLQSAAMDCVASREPQRCGMLYFDIKGPFLRMRLPSGRYIHYCRPRLEMVEIEFEDDDGKVIKQRKKGLTYERLSQSSKKWVRRANHGGRFIEQAVQGIALDVLDHGLRNADDAGFELVGHYHDEILALTDRRGGLDLEDLISSMTEMPPWAKTMMVRAEGYEDNFYHK